MGDDMFITKIGCEVLTRGCPKEIREIEALIATTNETASFGSMCVWIRIGSFAV
jgi:hypothetical protein